MATIQCFSGRPGRRPLHGAPGTSHLSYGASRTSPPTCGVSGTSPPTVRGVEDVAPYMRGVEDVAPYMRGVEDVAPYVRGVEDVATYMRDARGVEDVASYMWGIGDVATYMRGARGVGDVAPLFFCIQFVVVPTNGVFVYVFYMFFIVFAISDNMVMKISLPNVPAAFFIAKPFECRHKLRYRCMLLCRGRRPRRPALRHKQHHMDVICNNIFVNPYMIVKIVKLPDISLRDFSVWQQFNVFRGARNVAPFMRGARDVAPFMRGVGDVAPYDARQNLSPAFRTYRYKICACGAVIKVLQSC